MTEVKIVEFTPGGKPVTHGKTVTYNYGCRCEECSDARRELTRKAREKRLERTAEGAVGGEHGKAATYSNWNCRCRPCTDAWNEFCNKATDKRAEKAARGEVEIPHGTWNGYQSYKCRCADCLGDVAEKSASDRDKYRSGELTARHGTSTMYLLLGCRCDKCEVYGVTYRETVNQKARDKRAALKVEKAKALLEEQGYTVEKEQKK